MHEKLHFYQFVTVIIYIYTKIAQYCINALIAHPCRLLNNRKLFTNIISLITENCSSHGNNPLQFNLLRQFTLKNKIVINDGTVIFPSFVSKTLSSDSGPLFVLKSLFLSYIIIGRQQKG